VDISCWVVLEAVLPSGWHNNIIHTGIYLVEKNNTYYNIIIIIIIMYKIFKKTYDRQKPSTAAVICRNRTRTLRGGSPSPPPYPCWQWSSSATAALSQWSQSRSTTCAVRSSLVCRVVSYRIRRLQTENLTSRYLKLQSIHFYL